LVSDGNGLFSFTPEHAVAEQPQRPTPSVILGTEVSCIYPQDGRSHRVHLLLFAPSFDAVHKLCHAFAPVGSLRADARPMLKMSSHDVLATALDINDRCVVIPVHAWTPWYSMYGSKGGFDSIEDCFGDLTPHIHAIETGLSSDPSMNWRIPELDDLSFVSFSDAHSAQRMGRELTYFAGEPSYDGFRYGIANGGVEYTVEFYPEEGKYHYDGHRKCNVCQHPAVTLERGERCPECGRKLTVGVLNRMESLATRPPSVEMGDAGFYRDHHARRAPFRRLVPLAEVIAEATGRGPATKGVRAVYDSLIARLGSELHVLQDASADAIEEVAGERVADGVVRARTGQVTIDPGYDGVYGTVRLW
jgi:uncharacterized protein (TIGR00375 family)